MRIEIIDNKKNLISGFDLEANPFKIGETINVNVSNNDKKFWNVDEEVCGNYRIDKIEHFLREDYRLNQKYNFNFCVSVEVTKLS